MSGNDVVSDHFKIEAEPVFMACEKALTYDLTMQA